VVEFLAERIRVGAYRPGERLPVEVEVQAALGVSRMVVREAISRLRAIGMVETRQGSGSFVCEPRSTGGFELDPAATIADVGAMLELRMSLETEAAALAAQRRSDADLVRMRRALDDMETALALGGDRAGPDEAFHLAIAGATDNRFFEQAYRESRVVTVAGRLVELGAAALAAARTSPRDALREHRSIFDAIRSGDGESARAAMRLHLVATRERVCGSS
jgi:DNA-binding FadR family transcriptional regulator